jgi:hypothetical protein
MSTGRRGSATGVERTAAVAPVAGGRWYAIEQVFVLVEVV